MIELKKSSAGDPDFVALVAKLDADLAIRDGDDHDFYHQFNLLHDIKYATVAYLAQTPVGCGAIKEFDDKTMEVKRMYVNESERGKGIATEILNYLENWAKDLGYDRCILETGIRQPEAIGLYKKNGYEVIANYGQYEGISNSVCFEKKL